jgi:tetratricopeptide (TPR) repeat protein
MALELRLLFSDPTHVIVRFTEDGESTDTDVLPFQSPLQVADQRDLQWYLEVYPTYYTTEVDDAQATRIADRLPDWGAALFTAVFAPPAAARLVHRFQDAAKPGRLLTVSSGHPAVLGQPWELLRDPTGTYLFLERPRIAVRRRLAGAGGGRRPFAVRPKDRLHLLFVVSRPTNATFLDPRSDPQAVLDAVEAEAPGRVTVEFLRPATLAHLLRRLEDERLPPVDILHFDGHGVYDPDGRLTAKAARAPIPAGLAPLLRQETGGPGGQGYLLFEAEDGAEALISATLLGDVLHRQQVGLIVLSACQSAMVGGEDPMGSVAARLTHAGLPAVLAMTASVLAPTTRALFGTFYGELARGLALGTALENARRALYTQPVRSERLRGPARVPLVLQDWFVPALYQAGRDTALLTDAPSLVPTPTQWGNLPAVQEAGFHGRTRELWAIERAFVRSTRRLVVHGFGGQGKTSLALEAGRWLHRTGMFARVCFVSYADFQGVDPVGLAVSTLATVLDCSLPDAVAAAAALTETPTLLILDNLESLDPEPRRELLDAAVAWSEVGASRVLLTTRPPELTHPAYPTQESLRCQYLALDGLAPEDALAWCQALMRLPPAPQVPLPPPEALTTLFAQVHFHPLSVGVLARELKVRRVAELGERLETLLQEAESPLIASLNLSLERLAPGAQPWLPRLGVFQGGAFEDDLLTITEIPPDQWGVLRQGLEATGLVQVEAVPGVSPLFLRFHPTLAPAVWGQLTPEEQAFVTNSYRKVYYKLSSYLREQDSQSQLQAVRLIVRLELSNLLAAVHGALAVGEPWATDFADHLIWFSRVLGRRGDAAQLTGRVQDQPLKIGSESWFIARRNQAQRLFDAGYYLQASAVFQDILAHLGEAHTSQRSSALFQLARCDHSRGKTAKAKALVHQALTEAQSLELTQHVQLMIGDRQAELGGILSDQGEYAAARAAYEAALAITEETNNHRAVLLIWDHLGLLALEQGALAEAEQRYRKCLETFQALHESASEAVAWHQLGRVYQEAERWDDAERAYRESALINEHLGDRVTAANTWDQLAQIMGHVGRKEAAEAWFLKALESRRAIGDRVGEAKTLQNLAIHLLTWPGRLTEACTYAEAALAIRKSLDPAVGQIWLTYILLADLASRNGQSQEAGTFRQQAREAWMGFRGAWAEVREHGPLITAVLRVIADPSQRLALEEQLDAGINRAGRP